MTHPSFPPIIAHIWSMFLGDTIKTSVSLIHYYADAYFFSRDCMVPCKSAGKCPLIDRVGCIFFDWMIEYFKRLHIFQKGCGCMNKDIGIKIKSMREARHISQSELAKMAGVAQSTLSYIENGKKNPQFSTLSSICKGLGTTVLELLTYKEQKAAAKILEQNVSGSHDNEAIAHFKNNLPPEAKKELYEFERYLYYKYTQGENNQ